MDTTAKSSEEQFHELTQKDPLPRKWLVMLAMGMGMFIYALDVYIIIIALPVLGESLHASFATLQWVVLSYLLMLTTLVLGAGRLGDMWSKKWLYFGGVILFSISSLLCGLAPNVGFLIGFRTLQGLGGVFIAAMAPAIITEVFPEKQRGQALGILSAIFSIGIAMGPAAGGLLIALGGWRLVFLINVPIGVVACLLVALVVPSSAQSDVKQSFDLIGALLMILTLSCLALATSQIQSESFSLTTKLALLGLAAIGFVSFLLVEAHQPEPMLDLKIFRNIELSLGSLLALLVYVVIVAADFILPFFLELVKRYRAGEAGLLLMVFPILTAAIAPVAGLLSDRLKPRIVSLVGLLLLLLGCWGMSTFDTNLTVLGYIVQIALFGMGVGICLTPNSSAIMGAVPQERLGIASGLLSLSRTLGLTTGLSLLGTLFSVLTISHTKLVSNLELRATRGTPDIDLLNAPIESLVFGVQTTFRVAGLILIAATLLAAFLWWLEQRREKQQLSER